MAAALLWVLTPKLWLDYENNRATDEMNYVASEASRILSLGFCSAWSMPGNDDATRLNNCTHVILSVTIRYTHSTIARQQSRPFCYTLMQTTVTYTVYTNGTCITYEQFCRLGQAHGLDLRGQGTRPEQKVRYALHLTALQDRQWTKF